MVEDCGSGFHFHQVSLQTLQQGDIDAALNHPLQQLTLAINRFIKGNDSFTARENPDYPAYDTNDQLMRLDEWIAHQDGGETA